MITLSINLLTLTDGKVLCPGQRRCSLRDRGPFLSFFALIFKLHIFKLHKQYDSNKEPEGETHFVSQIPYSSSLKNLTACLWNL